MSDMRYLRKRRGRWLVQVAVPKDLRDRFGKANVERYLGTSSEAEAKRLKHAAMADILASFERACEGSPIRSDELNAQAEIELRRAYDALAADFLDSHGRLPDLGREVGEDAADLIGASFETNRLLGPSSRQAHDRTRRRGLGADRNAERQCRYDPRPGSCRRTRGRQDRRVHHLGPATGPMTKEAVKAGFYETEYGKYPRLQILTIEDRFAGKKPNIPLVDPSVFKKATEEQREKQSELF